MALIMAFPRMLCLFSFLGLCWLPPANADVLDRIDWTNYESNIAVDATGKLTVKEVHTVFVRGTINSLQIPLGLEGDQKAQVEELYQYKILPKVEKIFYKLSPDGAPQTYRIDNGKLEWFFREGDSEKNISQTYTFHLVYSIDKSLTKDDMGYFRVKRRIGPNSKIGRIRNFLVTATIDDKAWIAADPLPKGNEFFDVAGSHIFNMNLKLSKREKDAEKESIVAGSKKDFIIACRIKSELIENSFYLLSAGTPRQYIQWAPERTITFDGFMQEQVMEDKNKERQLHLKSVAITPSPTFSIENQTVTQDPETIAFYRGNFELNKDSQMKNIADWLGHAFASAALWPGLKAKPGQITRKLNNVNYSLTVYETGIAAHINSDKILAAGIEGEALAGFPIPQKMDVTLNTTLVQGVKATVELEQCLNYL